MKSKGTEVKKKVNISFSWKIKKARNAERVGAMYCFKRCDVNQN